MHMPSVQAFRKWFVSVAEKATSLSPGPLIAPSNTMMMNYTNIADKQADQFPFDMRYPCHRHTHTPHL